jgi:hypothetical protein
MLKQTVTYEDFDEQQVTETLYFHLSKSELIDMENSVEGGMAAKLERIGNSNNGAQIMGGFNDLILAAYSQRDPVNATKFYKSDKMREEFSGSLAYDALLTALVTDSSVAAKFVNGLLPKDLMDGSFAAKAKAEGSLQKVQLPPDPNGLDEDGSWPTAKRVLPPGHVPIEQTDWADREPTQKELIAMTREQLHEVYARKSSQPHRIQS